MPMSETMSMPSADVHSSDRTPAASQISKAEQLARTRRNQQRCRERKRAHVMELEGQVEALQAKIRQCEPCESPSVPEHESALDTARRENAARRDLLLALGFDDEIQQRFVQSAAKRQAVYTILQGDCDGISPSQNPGDQLAETPLAQFARFEAQPAGTIADFADLGSGTGQARDSINNNTVITDVAMNRQSNVLDPTIENWLFSPETLDKILPSSMDPFGDASWFTEPYNTYRNFGQGVANTVERTDAAPARRTMPDSSMDSLGNGMRFTSITSENNPSADRQSIERCFMDTVVNLQPVETSTVCSLALSLIFRYNRKGLSMAELQKKLEPGMRPTSGASGECRINDGVLFQVLADISISES